MFFDIQTLKGLSIAKKYPANTVIVTEGEESPYNLYIVLSGTLRVVKNYDSHHPNVVAKLGPGEVFGEMSLFLKKPRTATVVTAEETVVLEVQQSDVYELIRSNPEMIYGILKTLCVRVDELNNRVRSRSLS
ncbi:MAG: cyclic nucleotide-binding domain-containing protein [Defluviitaleaceae bacterium]|nr:cyclic nucleotide-binding domain-containing protein [Defluviitaleaceae bacterium]